MGPDGKVGYSIGRVFTAVFRERTGGLKAAQHKYFYSLCPFLSLHARASMVYMFCFVIIGYP